MKIAIAGSSGFIGTRLVESLMSDGHDVLRLVRRPATSATEVQWDPQTGSVDLERLAGIDAIINLAGAGVGDRRWTNTYKRIILESRVSATNVCADIAVQLRPGVLINASAIGWYGDTGSTAVDESTERGDGFLADVVAQWEAATQPAQAAGIRVVNIRTGLVVAAHGGAWARMLPLFKLGLGGRLGNGKQYWSYISLQDEIDAIKFLLHHGAISGPVNLTAPTPATNSEVTTAMSRLLRRPALFHVPAFALKLVLGEFSQEVLGSSRVLPKALLDAGFRFTHDTLDKTLATLVDNT